jgi:hypothetical protein
MDIARLEVHAVQPQKWKAFVGLTGKDKDASLAMAARLYPSAEPLLKRKKDHGRAEALLVAHWARMNLK